MITSNPVERLFLKPKYKWFSNQYKNAEDDWNGPFKTIQEAAVEGFKFITQDEEQNVFVAQGRRLTKDEKEIDPTFDWHVETENCLEIRL